ncbi:hypothetical protein IQ266_07215 [filamentous cyanobacterium LEGE 11480]|uniref:Uncharacterized protein n=1 Tax=Romeriopsis navalis LEGE 11480 TaxID=2777977 RepID=A0A928Z1P2_9CYAN|nr:hypothetical protein [Romeriopsis navalis]MBE9029551.1 hypothetical protein [Romeriopsis navalis LEGE 11480]
MTHQNRTKDPKVKTTSAIWAMATGMLGICIPLVAITESGVILPLLVILGATTATSVIWLAPDRKAQLQLQRSTEVIQSLETRIENLETICSGVEFDIQQRLSSHEQTATATDSQQQPIV